MSTGSDTTACSQSRPFCQPPNVPGVLAAFSPGNGAASRLCAIHSSLVIGRSPRCDYLINDEKISKRHCRISKTAQEFFIEDLKSTNGTFLNGHPVLSLAPLSDGDVIRAGRSVLVFVENILPISTPASHQPFNIQGKFYASTIVDNLQDAANSLRHVLLTGPSGSGKELAAKALKDMINLPQNAPYIVHNAARFASEEEAAVTLFGVAPRFFSGVDGRKGLIESAFGGVLFLDEIHNIPSRLQRSLLRVIEDGRFTRVGETSSRAGNVRFIFASNDTSLHCGLAHDLYARLRPVIIPSLKERRADIPSIFSFILKKSMETANLDPKTIDHLFSGDHFESMVLDGFEENNVRGIGQIVDEVVSSMKSGKPPTQVIAKVFSRRYNNSLVVTRKTMPDSTSHYEQHREMIISAYKESHFNLSATERLLKSRNFICCRRVLADYLSKWKVKR